MTERSISAVKRIRHMSSMHRRSFWYWFDVNRSSFDEDIYKQKTIFYIFVCSDLDTWIFRP